MKTRIMGACWGIVAVASAMATTEVAGQITAGGRRIVVSQERLFAGEASATDPADEPTSRVTVYNLPPPTRPAASPTPDSSYTPVLRREWAATPAGYPGGHRPNAGLPPGSENFQASAPSPPVRRFAAYQADGRPTPAEAKPLPPTGAATTEPLHGMTDCNSCGPSDDVDVLLNPDRWFTPGRGSWVVGAEYLFARPHFSEPVAYIIQIRGQVGPGNQVYNADLPVYFAYDYESSFRTYLAYRMDDCCSELRFTWTNLDSHASKAATTDAAGQIVPTRFEVQPLPGNTLTANSRIKGDIWDVDFSRCIRQGDECCEPCDPCQPCCPRWDLTWSVGAKLADWGYNYNVATNVATDGRIDVEMDYIGAGPKVGLEGRRYWGQGAFSIYSSLDVALLLGWFEHDLQRTIPPFGVNPTSVEQFQSKITRTVPMTEIELGATWQPARNWEISLGWFFQAWWDLGMSETQTSNLFGGNGPQYMLDDSNIMSWDGLTARVEFTW